jgi:hypothetical protein
MTLKYLCKSHFPSLLQAEKVNVRGSLISNIKKSCREGCAVLYDVRPVPLRRCRTESKPGETRLELDFLKGDKDYEFANQKTVARCGCAGARGLSKTV